MRLLAMGVLLSMSCAPVQRETRLRASIEGGGSKVTDRGFGCDGDLQHETEHQQAGGLLEVSLQDESGINASVHGGALGASAEITLDNREPDPERPAQPDTYTLIEIGASFGYDFKYWGVDVGFNTVFNPEREFIIWPTLALRAGIWGHEAGDYWGELRGGAPRLQAGRISSIAFHARPVPWFHGELGVGLALVPIEDAYGLTFADTVHEPFPPPQIFLRTDFSIPGGFGVLLGGSVTPVRGASADWRFLTGFYYELDIRAAFADDPPP